MLLVDVVAEAVAGVVVAGIVLLLQIDVAAVAEPAVVFLICRKSPFKMAISLENRHSEWRFSNEEIAI